MPWKVTTQPAVEPLTLAQAKAQLRVQHSAEDTLIEDVIKAARSYCEEELDLAIIEQTITLKFDDFPDKRTIHLPRSNLLFVTSVDYLDGNGVSQSFTDFTEDTFMTPGRIVNNTDTWPDTKDVANAVTIVYQAGFSELETGNTHNTPNAVLQAMRMLVTHFYDNRNAVSIGSGVTSDEVAMAVSACLQKFRSLGV